MKNIEEISKLIFNSFISLFFCFIRLNNRKVIITSTRNISYNFNSKYLFEYLTRGEGDGFFDVYYVINDDEKRQQLNTSYSTTRFIESKTLSGTLFCLNAKFWVSSTFELPVNSLFRNRKRTVLHLGHGVPLKKIGLNEERVSLFKKVNRLIRTRQFTDIICYSEFFKDSMIRTFRNASANYLYLGQPRNDSLFLDKSLARKKLQEHSHANDNAQFILYAPTWRPYKTTVFFPFQLSAPSFGNFLSKENIYIFIRSHPFYPSTISSEVQSIENIIEFNSDVAPEICDYLTGFDGVITDYSSIYIDYLVTGHKVAFIPYDLTDYKDKVGFCYPYHEFTPGIKIFSQSDLMSFLLSGDKEFEDERLKIKSITNTKNAGNCFEIVEYLKRNIRTDQ